MEGSEPRYDFPAISAGDQEAGPRLGEAGLGDVTTRAETVYEDIGGDWEHGEWGPEIGTLTLTHTPTGTRGRIWVTALFAFHNDETVEYTGLVPGGDSWKGMGKLGYRGGTGKFADRRGEIEVRSTNPKRWG